MFGISCAPEMYQRVMQQALEGCEGVRNMHAYDDIIVHERQPNSMTHDLKKPWEGSRKRV